MIWFFANNQLKFFKRFVSGHFTSCSFWNGLKGKEDWLVEKKKKKKSMTKQKILVIKWMELKMEIYSGWLVSQPKRWITSDLDLRSGRLFVTPRVTI